MARARFRLHPAGRFPRRRRHDSNASVSPFLKLVERYNLELEDETGA